MREELAVTCENINRRNRNTLARRRSVRHHLESFGECRRAPNLITIIVSYATPFASPF
eukprot:SAG31_NODE_11617_length_1013_cov_0.782276_3_plen_57_part_01